MTTEEAMTRVAVRIDVVRAMRDGAEEELGTLEALLEALEVRGTYGDSLAIILDVLREDES